MKLHYAIAATLFACLPAIAGERHSVAEFTPEESTKLDWNIVDDGVMGDLSQGKREIGKDGILRFFGTLALENNGGFSSLRTGDVNWILAVPKGLSCGSKATVALTSYASALMPNTADAKCRSKPGFQLKRASGPK